MRVLTFLSASGMVVAASMFMDIPANAQDQSPPWSQADAHYDSDAMAQARHAVQAEPGGQMG